MGVLPDGSHSIVVRGCVVNIDEIIKAAAREIVNGLLWWDVEDHKAHAREATEVILRRHFAGLEADMQRADKALDETMEERDAMEAALSETHRALGGDGEWVCRVPEPPPPDSGDLRRDVPALAREVMEAEQWQDIETAPKDGTVILLYRRSQYTGYYGGADSGWRFNDPLKTGMWPLPTHWRPLPPPPKEADND